MEKEKKSQCSNALMAGLFNPLAWDDGRLRMSSTTAFQVAKAADPALHL